MLNHTLPLLTHSMTLGFLTSDNGFKVLYYGLMTNWLECGVADLQTFANSWSSVKVFFPHEFVLKFWPGSSISVSPYKAPRNLQTSEPTKTSFRVTWDPAPGDVRGYKVTFHPSGNDVDLGELLVGPYDSTVVLEELR